MRDPFATSAEALNVGTACPVCGNAELESTPATIYLFFRVRCRILPEQEIKSVFCGKCEHVFFDPQPTDEQLARYYGDGYDSWFHNQERIAFEPWWADNLKMVADPNSGHWSNRWTIYKEGLAEFSSFAGHVVDFGGGDGSLTRKIFPMARVSVIDAVFTGDRAALLSSCDFLFAAHVLEHLSRPYEALSSLTAALRPGTWVWTEVPEQYRPDLRSRWHETASGGSQNGALVEMHEHIQHFSTSSLRTLMGRCGVKVERTVVLLENIIAMLGRKSSA